jgi:hypothetical protein
VYNERGKKLIRSTVEPVTLSSYQFPRGYLTPHHYYKGLISDYLVDATNKVPGLKKYFLFTFSLHLFRSMFEL